MADFSSLPMPVGGATLLTEGAREFIGHSTRANTRRAYAAQWRAWEAWTASQGMPAAPANVVDVANWLAERAARGAGLSTLRVAVAAVKTATEAKGFALDTKAAVITRTLRGIGNATARLPRQAEPLRGLEILEIIDALGPAPIDRRDAALLAAGYVFALRRSELVGLDLETLGNGTGVLRITPRHVEIAFARSKTCRDGEPETVVIPRDQNFQAVAAIEAWLRIANVHPGEPIFRSIRKGGGIGGRLTAGSVAGIIKIRAGEAYVRRGLAPEKAAVEAERYSAHSLRTGLCVSAAEAGADLRSIASVTRHRSLTMPARYAAKADALRTSPHRLPGVGLGRPLG